jgi:hypothetical protein
MLIRSLLELWVSSGVHLGVESSREQSFTCQNHFERAVHSKHFVSFIEDSMNRTPTLVVLMSAIPVSANAPSSST